MASLLAPPQYGSGRSRSRSGMSRLSSAACAAEYPPAADLQEPPTSNSDRQEARRRVGRSGKVVHDVGLLSDSDDEGGNELSPQLMQLQEPTDSCVRRVTFSTAGGPEAQQQLLLQQQQQQQQQQPQSEQPPPFLVHTARLWRGAAVSVCAGQRLQSLERHAAELKQRQEIHTELKAWIVEALSRPQDELLQPGLEDSDLQLGHASAHAQQQQQQQQLMQQDDGAGPVGEQQRRRKSSHRHHRRHHGHRHHAAATEGGEATPQQKADGDAAAAAAAAAAQDGAVSAPAEGAETGQQGPGQELPLLVPQQGGDEWHQFNAAEQQLIAAQLQQDQQTLMEQLQQAYQQIAALTTAQQAAAVAAAAAGPGDGQQQQQQADAVLHPAPDTQVLVINSNSSCQDSTLSDTSPSQQEVAQQSDQQEADAAAAAQPTAPAARRSSISSPRSKLAGKAAAGSQPTSSPRTPRAAAKPGSKAAVAAAPADAAAPNSPRKSLAAAAAAKGKGCPSLPVPQGRGLTLPQQQALVQRVQQAEEVMDLLQQDLTDALQAQQQLQEQMQQMQEAGCAEGQAHDQEPQQQQQQAQVEGSCSGQLGQSSRMSTAEQQAVAAAELTARQKQLQEQVQVSTAAQQELAEARSTVSAEQQQIAELQQQLQQHEELGQQQAQQIQALREELVAVIENLQSLQHQHQALLAAQESAQAADSVPPQQQQLQDGMLLQQLGAAAVAAGGGPVCCQHEARCQQLQSVLQALMQQMQQPQQIQQQYGASCMRPNTAAAQGSPRMRASWQHRPVELHTWLYPPLQVSRPATPRTAQLQPPGATACMRSVSAPRCATASSPRSPQWERARRCNTNGPLTARCAGSGGAGVLQDGAGVLQSLDFRLRPLTYRGPDRAGADAVLSATGGRRRLSADAERGLLSSLVVAPVSARGAADGHVVAGQVAGVPHDSPRGGRDGSGHGVQQGAARRGIPRLALGGLH